MNKKYYALIPMMGLVFGLNIGVVGAHYEFNGDRPYNGDKPPFELSEEQKDQFMQDRISDASTIIGLSVSEINSRIENGEKLHEIIESTGLSRVDFHEKMHSILNARFQVRLSEAVSEGKISQLKADKILSKVKERKDNVGRKMILKVSQRFE